MLTEIRVPGWQCTQECKDELHRNEMKTHSVWLTVEPYLGRRDSTESSNKVEGGQR
jgi:hypothetical protein